LARHEKVLIKLGVIYLIPDEYRTNCAVDKQIKILVKISMKICFNW